MRPNKSHYLFVISARIVFLMCVTLADVYDLILHAKYDEIDPDTLLYRKMKIFLTNTIFLGWPCAFVLFDALTFNMLNFF